MTRTTTKKEEDRKLSGSLTMSTIRPGQPYNEAYRTSKSQKKRTCPATTTKDDDQGKQRYYKTLTKKRRDEDRQSKIAVLVCSSNDVSIGWFMAVILKPFVHYHIMCIHFHMYTTLCPQRTYYVHNHYDVLSTKDKNHIGHL